MILFRSPLSSSAYDVLVTLVIVFSSFYLTLCYCYSLCIILSKLIKHSQHDLLYMVIKLLYLRMTYPAFVKNRRVSHEGAIELKIMLYIF